MIPFQSNGIAISYNVIGEGNSLLLLHGFLENSSMWENLIPELEERFQIIIIDLPGHGTSPEPQAYTLPEVANTIKDLLEHLNIASLAVLGHSMGGYIALELKKIVEAKVILLHSNFWEDSAQKKEDRNRVIELIKTKKNHFVSEAIPNLFSSINVEHCQEAIELLINDAQKMTETSIAQATAAMRDRVSNYNSIQNADIIHGADDPIIGTEILGDEIEKNGIDAKVYTIENCGHMSIWESKEELINILNHILI